MFFENILHSCPQILEGEISKLSNTHIQRPLCSWLSAGHGYVWCCLCHFRNQLLLPKPRLRSIAEDCRWQWGISHGGHGTHQRAGGGWCGAIPLRTLPRGVYYHPQNSERLPSRHDLLQERCAFEHGVQAGCWVILSPLGIHMLFWKLGKTLTWDPLKILGSLKELLKRRQWQAL